MSKRRFVAPYILLSAGSGGSGSDIGHGSGQSTTDLISPMSFEAWLASDLSDDLIEDGTIDFNDYVAWWGGMMALNSAFDQAAWESFGNEDWDEYFGD